MSGPDTHVYPLGDVFPHDTESRDCECNPQLKVLEDDSIMVVHNSYDGREIFEELEKAEQ